MNISLVKNWSSSVKFDPATLVENWSSGVKFDPATRMYDSSGWKCACINTSAAFSALFYFTFSKKPFPSP